MIGILSRLFVKEYQHPELPTVRNAYGRMAGLVGICTNLLLAAVKILTGIFCGSIAILADGINNLSDSASSIVTMVGFRMALKPADKEHPFGHARMEYVAGLIVSVVVLFLGFELGRSSIEKIFYPEESEFSLLVLLILGGSVLLKLWQSFFYRQIGRKINSATLKAASADSRNDVIATSVVLAGAIFTKITGWNLDGYLGTAVALFILLSGIQLIRETTDPLLGTAPKEEVIHSLTQLFQETDRILGYHDLHIHDYGAGRQFATVHLELDSSMDLEQGHTIIDHLERKVRTELKMELVTHIDPIVIGDSSTDDLHQKIESAIHGMDPSFCIHDFHVEWENPPVVLFDLLVPYHYSKSDETLLSAAEDKIHSVDPQLQVQIIIDHGEVMKS